MKACRLRLGEVVSAHRNNLLFLALCVGVWLNAILLIGNLVAYSLMKYRAVDFIAKEAAKAELISNIRLDELKRKMTAAAKMSEVVVELPQIAGRAGVSISDINYKPFSVEGGKFKRLELSMKATGSYSKMRKFIYELESMGELVKVQSRGLRRKGGDSNVVNMNIKLSLYFI